MVVLHHCCRQISMALKCKTNTSFVNSFILKTDPWETYIIGLKNANLLLFYDLANIWNMPVMEILMKLPFPIGKLFPINFPAAHQFWTIMIGINIQLELYDICSTKPQWHILLWVGLKIGRRGSNQGNPVFLQGTLVYENLQTFSCLNQNRHWKLGQQTPSVGTILAYLETTAQIIFFLGIKLFCFSR